MTRALKSDEYGTTLWIEREAAGMHRLQLWRELVQNAAEANATRVVIDGYEDPETGLVLARITDDGHGLSEANLIKHFETLHLTGKVKGKNYGIGARIAALPHNPAGITFASRTAAGGDAMIKLWKDGGVYGLVDWTVDDDGYEVTESAVFPDGDELSRADASGTAVILHGDGKSDTWDAQTAWQVHRFLAERYYEFPNGVDVKIINPKTQPVYSTGTVLAAIAEADGELPFKNVAGLNGVMFWWTLPTPAEYIGWNSTGGGVGLVVEDEVFNYAKTYLSDFGVLYRSVQNRVAILIWIDGSSMDSGRSGVVLPGEHKKSTPWKALGAHFAAHMPAEIDELLSRVTVSSASFDQRLAKLLDEDWMKHLQPIPVAVRTEDGDLTTGEDDGEAIPPKGDEPGKSSRSSLHSTSTNAPFRKSDGKRPAKPKPKIVTPEVEFVDPDEMPAGSDYITYNENANKVMVSKALPPYVREIDRWVESTGHPRHLVADAVELGYKSELAGAIIDANGQKRFGLDPAFAAELKSDAALYAKTLGMQSLTARIEQFLKDAVKTA